MKKPVLIAIAVAVLAVGWILSGFIIPSDKAGHHGAASSETAQQDVAKTAQVRVKDSLAAPFTTQISVTGKTSASRTVVMKAEVDGQITELLADKGMQVTTGQAIARIDKKDRGSRVAESRELVKQRNIEYTAAIRLEKEGYYSKTKLAQAASALEGAKADLKMAELNLGNTEIKAPFDGVIGGKSVNVGDYVTAGTGVMTIVDLNPLKLTGSVSERVVLDLAAGAPVTGTLLNGAVVKGVLSFIAPAADPATRTFPVEIKLPNDEGRLVEGLTVEITIPTAERPGHKISPSILTLNDQGQIGVKIVDDNNVVSFVPVTILADMPDHAWIGGLPDKVRIITVGQDYVVPGQVVEPVVSTDKDGLL